jgi:hypothetical protein
MRMPRIRGMFLARNLPPVFAYESGQPDVAGDRGEHFGQFDAPDHRPAGLKNQVTADHEQFAAISDPGDG